MDNRAAGGAHRNQPPEAAAKNMVEQIFENLNMITEQEILELVLKLRQKMESDVQGRAALVSAASIHDIPQPQLLRRDF